MRGHWLSQTRKLNRHYQSTPTQQYFDPPAIAVYSGNMPIRWSATEHITEWAEQIVSVDAIGPYWSDTQSQYFWAWGNDVASINLIKTIAGSTNSISYASTKIDYIDVQTVHGDPPNYITPYFGGSRDDVSGDLSVVGGASRKADKDLEITIEANTTISITLQKVITDRYHQAGTQATFSGASSTDIYHPSLVGSFYLVDINDTTNYIPLWLGSYGRFTLDNYITKRANLLTASNWTKNTIPERYKVVFNGGSIRSAMYTSPPFDWITNVVAVDMSGTTGFKITIEEL